MITNLMVKITEIYYLTVSAGQMSGHSVAQLVPCLVSQGQNRGVIRTVLLSRSSGNESTFQLIQVIARIQIHVGRRSLFP